LTKKVRKKVKANTNAPRVLPANAHQDSDKGNFLSYTKWQIEESAACYSKQREALYSA